MTLIVSFIERLTTALGSIGAVLMIPLVLATCYEVVARHMFGAPTVWAFELGYMLMGIHFLFGGPFATKTEAHVRVDLLYAKFSPRLKAAIDGTLYLVLLCCLVLVTARLFDYTAGAFTSGEGSGQSAWNPPVWPFRALICLSFAVLTLQIFAEVLKCLLVFTGHRLQTRQESNP